MAYDGRVYRILIASPSDVEDERDIAVRVIQEWNDLYSYSRKVVLLPLRWETHTAPEYGTRPQEVINRAIVDQCDLLVGIFWTRIGSPTGTAKSGTLEEIERVGKAAKPVMLYFSRVAIDPENIDLSQSEMLKQFKQNAYPNGLVESYRTQIEFRDKFARQLELKVRDLQKSDDSGGIPLTLEFLAIDEAQVIGTNINHICENPMVASFDAVKEDQRNLIEKFAAQKAREISYVPIPLAIINASSSGIRNVYIELDFRANSSKIELTDALPEFEELALVGSFPRIRSDIERRVRSKLSRFDADELQRVDGGWRLSIEWEAIQPQRTRLIKPVLYVYAQESGELEITARVFGDSFPEPLQLSACVNLQVTQKELLLEELLPNWEKLAKEEGKLFRNALEKNLVWHFAR